MGTERGHLPGLVGQRLPLGIVHASDERTRAMWAPHGGWRDAMRNYGIIGTLVIIILVVLLLRLLGVF